jgi:glycosyltransferase involved in cell wall biosynthesis
MNEVFSNSILVIGPAYKKHKGGIGAVIAEQKKLFPKSKFYCSYKPTGSLQSIFFSLMQLLIFPFYLLLNSGIKIVHIHGASRGSFYRKYVYFTIAKRLFGKKVIYHIHGAEFHLFISESSDRWKNRIKKTLESADQVIVLSNWWFTFFQERFPKSKITRIYNPVELTDYNKADEYQGIVKFLFLGHISSRKGCYDLLNVAEKMVKKNSNFIIEIGGNGETDKLKEMIQQRNLGTYVHFLGWVSGEKKKLLLQNSDIYVLPSKNEGLPVSILEAMSYGMPIISTIVGGIPEMIEDQNSGFLIDPGDLDALYEKMLFFIENRQKIKEMGQVSKKIVAIKFSSDIIKDELSKLYVKLLESK